MQFLSNLIYFEFFLSILIVAILIILFVTKNLFNTNYLIGVSFITLCSFFTFFYQDYLVAQQYKYMFYNWYLYKMLYLQDNLIISKPLILYINLTNLIKLNVWDFRSDLVYLYPINIKFYNQNLMYNIFLHYSKGFITLVFLLSLYLSYKHFKLIKISLTKIFLLLTPVLLSNLMLISATDLIIAYLAIELQNLCLIFIMALKKKDPFNVQLSIRFFVLNSIGSLFVILGITLIYSVLLTTNLVKIYTILSTLPLTHLNSLNYEFLLGLSLLLIGLFFKLAVGPFGLWLVEIYEYGLTSSVIVYSLLPKIGYFVFLFHLYLSTSYFLFYWDFILKLFGIISIFFGTFGALSQVYFKRLLAFSSLNYFGYLLLSFIGFNQKSLIVCLLYFLIYVFVSIYIWYIVMYLEKLYKRHIVLTDLAILREKSEFLAYVLSFSLFCLASLPPFYLFVLKFITFNIFLYANVNILIIIFFLCCSFVSIYYYLKLIKIIHFNPTVSNGKTEKLDIYISSVYIFYIIAYILLILSPFFYYISQELIINFNIWLTEYLKNFVAVNIYSRILFSTNSIVHKRKLLHTMYNEGFKLFRFSWSLPPKVYTDSSKLHPYITRRLNYLNLYKWNRPINSYMSDYNAINSKKTYNSLISSLIERGYFKIRSRRAVFVSEFDQARMISLIERYKKIQKPMYMFARETFLKSLYIPSYLNYKKLSNMYKCLFPFKAPLRPMKMKPVAKGSPFYKYYFYRFFVLPTHRDNILFSLLFPKYKNKKPGVLSSYINHYNKHLYNFISTRLNKKK